MTEKQPAITPQTDKRKAPRSAWAPGRSGNPTGRPRKTPDARALEDACRAIAPDAVDVLRSLMVAADKDSVRLSAALAIIERAFGKPVVREERGTPGSFAVRNMTDQELIEDIRMRSAKLGIFTNVPGRLLQRKGAPDNE